VSGRRVLVSTHDLVRARSLKDAFAELGIRVEMVTPDEELSREADAGLLVVTGGALPGRLGEQAHLELSVPVFAVASGRKGTPGRSADAGRSSGPWDRTDGDRVDESFTADAADADIAHIGVRRMKMLRLQEETGIIGSTEAMREALEQVVHFGPVEATVLITGESGTGKELFARGIHRLSARRVKPFIAVNVGALSDSLLESELFGHEKGAFTGAVDRRKGLFELADSGTIFLDEIGEMPSATQTNLLRVLEQREFHRVGGEETVNVDVRIVAATNRDLPEVVVKGDFRRDLYYRLNVLSIRLPPLRERRADVPELVTAFVAESSERHGLSPPEIPPETMETLMAHSWPGNVRELRNLVESMVILAPRSPARPVLPDDLPYEVRRGGTLGGGVALVPAGPPGERRDSGRSGPELAVILRSLMELRTDLDELRGEFELFKSSGWKPSAPVVGRIASGSAVPEGELVEVVDLDETEARPDSGTHSPSKTPGKGSVEEVPVEGVSVEDEPSSADSSLFRPGMTMTELEREAIRATLDATGGNRREAAKILGIGERTLYRKISKYELS